MQIIFDDNGHSFTRVFTTENVELVNPIDYYKNYELLKRATILRDLIDSVDPFLSANLDDSFFLKNAEKTLGNMFQQLEQTEVHQNLLTLLETSRKKDQIRLLKGMTINPDQLMSLIFKSYSEFGFLYSKYYFENLPIGYENRKLPKLFQYKDDGTIEKVGETDLTDGELKNIIEQRKVIVAHFFERGDFWHCLFLTYNSVGGKENWKYGQAHFHYLSSSFGISKADFIESMRTGNYKSSSIHIDLYGYGNQVFE